MVILSLDVGLVDNEKLQRFRQSENVTSAKKNGQVINLDVPGQLVDSHTMVPIRFISESLGATVKWDRVTWTVNITTTAAENGDILPSEAEEAVPGTGSGSTTTE
ncbi:copper amine oxidase N-terminal domain-containing protein [Paenibacillus lentus]|uniref:copper amine oxidase N-terminal domain-containing protein n=1 Tax=Paenibacillus lentus TaxID=1338368 RepID=UPI001FE64167|nr:copper amine oxidase N-terminal domain-containing protein [Paenibacillus lentus]